MSDPSIRSDDPPKLACLGGVEAPDWLGPDLQCIARLPDSARAELWTALEAALPDPMRPEAEAKLDEFQSRHGGDASMLVRALKAARVLYREAARRDLDKAKLMADVRSLGGEHAAVLESVLGKYHAPAASFVRSELYAKTLAGHGKILTDLEWRTEIVASSNHGANLKLPLVTLTLHYEENGARQAITLTALPSLVQQLRDALTQVVT
ncbi:MAG: COMM domain-containing protein [Polyangiaceae bacterium]